MNDQELKSEAATRADHLRQIALAHAVKVNEVASSDTAGIVTQADAFRAFLMDGVVPQPVTQKGTASVTGTVSNPGTITA